MSLLDNVNSKTMYRYRKWSMIDCLRSKWTWLIVLFCLIVILRDGAMVLRDRRRQIRVQESLRLVYQRLFQDHSAFFVPLYARFVDFWQTFTFEWVQFALTSGCRRSRTHTSIPASRCRTCTSHHEPYGDPLASLCPGCGNKSNSPHAWRETPGLKRGTCSERNFRRQAFFHCCLWHFRNNGNMDNTRETFGQKEFSSNEVNRM